ncbi:MAG: hypothetical protein K6U11_05895 [bacterium]|nr:hypothetical protein [bacterium]
MFLSWGVCFWASTASPGRRVIIAESIHGIAKETRFPKREGDYALVYQSSQKSYTRFPKREGDCKIDCSLVSLS